MKKLLLIFLILPTFAFSETWDCEDRDTKGPFSFERNGNTIHYIHEQDEAKSTKTVIDILEESDLFIFAHSREVRDDGGFSTRMLTLNKKYQTFSFSSNYLFKTMAGFSGTSTGKCNVFEGKRIPKPSK